MGPGSSTWRWWALPAASIPPKSARSESPRTRIWPRRLESEGIEAFVERWEALPLFASQKELPEAVRAAMHAARIGQEPHALAAALRAFGLGAQSPLGGELARLSMPVLLVAGGRDSKYCRIAEQMGERIVGARVAIVPDAGHAVPLEKPGEFSALLAAFLSPRAAKEGLRS